MASQETPIDFGLFIAYVLPGFTALLGASYFSPEIQSWIGSSESQEPTLGGFLYMTVASIAAGLTVSTVRWLLMDTLHHWTGLKRPEWDFSRFQDYLGAYGVLTDIHYRYYQSNAGMVIAILWVAIARRNALGWNFDVIDAGLGVLVVIFFLGSRDSLRKYYVRTGQFLAARTAGKPPR